MSLFDPHSLYKHRQKQSKKGQVIQKKPVTTFRAYNKKDLEEAYRVLHTYGISYGPPPPTPEIIHTSAGSVDLSVVTNLSWTKNTSEFEPLELSDKDIMDHFWEQAGIGHWIATELDLSKVVSFNYTISSKNITYYYDVDEPHTGTLYNYEFPVRTQDRMDTFNYTLNFDSLEAGTTDVPDRYISKSVINWWQPNELRYVQEYLGYSNLFNAMLTFRNVFTTEYLDAIYVAKTDEDLSIEDLVNGNYTATTVARTVPTGSFDYNTAGCIATLANVYFKIQYTD